MTSAERTPLVVVDTNVLVAASDADRVSHVAARRFLEEDERRLALSPQIVREYLAVATRPVEVNGLGIPGPHAVTNVEQLLADMELLTEDLAATRRLLQLVRSDAASRKQVHDANVVAVALTHGATTVVTDDARHFARFEELLTIEALSDRAR